MFKVNLCAKPESYVQTYHVQICIRIKYLKKKEYEEVEDTKGVNRIRISKKNRQHNDQAKKYKRTNNNLQTMHIKLKIE
jgi:hypothetical protein